LIARAGVENLRNQSNDVCKLRYVEEARTAAQLDHSRLLFGVEVQGPTVPFTEPCDFVTLIVDSCAVDEAKVAITTQSDALDGGDVLFGLKLPLAELFTKEMIDP